MSFDDRFEREQTPATITLGRAFRIITQAVGLGLIVVGVYYGVWILVNSIQFALDPARLEGRVAAMEKSLDLAGLKIPAGPNQVPVGRPVANVLLLAWYLVGAWICCKVIAVGGQLAMGVVSERREFLTAMKEFLITARQQSGADKP
jgi:hypothetical protein